MHIIPIKSFSPEDYPSQDELLTTLTEPVIKANYHSIIKNHILGEISKEIDRMFYSNTNLI